MTSEQGLAELLGRLGASKGEVVMVSEGELAAWPDCALKVAKNAELLRPATPGSSVVCPGCEQECSMPVIERPAANAESSFFVICDKREDINRVSIPTPMLRRWAFSLHSVGSLVFRLLNLTGTVSVNGPRCEVGVLRGRRHSSHLTIIADGLLRLSVAGHIVNIEDILTLENDTVMVDRRSLERLVDNPTAGGGDGESAGARKKRLAREVDRERALGTRAFLKAVATREGISTQRLKQLLAAPDASRAGKRKRDGLARKS